MEASLGQIVYSKAGRDAGRRFVIVDIVDENHVLLCDGSLRKIEKPKRKKIRHLELTGEINLELNEKLTKNLKLSNSELRKQLTLSGQV